MNDKVCNVQTFNKWNDECSFKNKIKFNTTNDKMSKDNRMGYNQ